MKDGTVFCQSCHNRVFRVAPTIVQVPGDHERHKNGQSIPVMFDEATDAYTPSVATQFQQKWTNDTPCPEVRAIYRIVSTKASLKKYEQYLSVSFIIGDSSP